MEEDSYEMFYYDENDEDEKSKCRLCASVEKNKFLINIFGKIGRKHALDIKIRKCLPIVVREDDGMPKGVCLVCVNKLDVSYELVESCIRAHHTFLSVMTHDPDRAKGDRYAGTRDDLEDLSSVDNAVDEDALEELSDSVSTQVIEDYAPVVIKEEPMDLGDTEVEIQENVSVERNTAASTWLVGSMSASSKLKDTDNINSPLTNEKSQGMNSDSLSNVVVTSVNTITESPSHLSSQLETEHVALSGTQNLMESTEVTNNLSQEVETVLETKQEHSPQNPVEPANNVTIKEEPIGSPQQTSGEYTKHLLPGESTESVPQ